MAEFDELREQLGRVRLERDAASDTLAAARARLRRIIALEHEMDRALTADNQELQLKRVQLRDERRLVENQLETEKNKYRQAKTTEAIVFEDFSRFTDPRETIGNLNDHTPILMMPVRLETRFKRLTDSNTGLVSNQLWVRVYPDDCWIDTFDPVLTKTEVANAKLYWIGIWKAGGHADQELGAWGVLVNSHGSGRARWIVSQYLPLNIAAKPTKPAPEDVVLTIATETPLGTGEETAAAAYWREAWLADGDAEKLDLALTALQQAVGQARAEEILTNYQPVNFADSLASGLTKDQVNLSVASVVFGPVETKQAAWSRAPQMRVLPDRFVFIGYQGSSQTVFEVGRPVPSPLIAGPDPAAPREEQLQEDANGNLLVPEEMKWMTDFDRAVEVGMGFRINLNPAQAESGFDRVLVVGLRLNANAEQAKNELEALLTSHSMSKTGLALVPQGTPTNNTEAVGSGFDREDSTDESFADLKEPLFNPEVDWFLKRDGQWLAEYLGVNPELFHHVHNADASDQLAGRAMNTALWPATLGYWMESMMSGVFTRSGIEQTRAFFNNYVIGAGAIPALRIGSQPYGILPATALSRMNWLAQPLGNDGPVLTILPGNQNSILNYLRQLYPTLRAIDNDWRPLLESVSFVGKSGDQDPHKILLDIVGLHSGSVEWSHRYAESFQTVFNRLMLQGLHGFFQALLLAHQRQSAQQLLQKFGVSSKITPPILDKVFSGRHSQLKGGVVDDKPLSEKELIRAYTDSGQNYVQWLIDAANISLDALYKQDGFKDDKPPTALFYLLLRHALQLGYDDVSIRLREDLGIYTPEAAMKARVDEPILHIRQSAQKSESRYQPLYEAVPEITGSPTQPVHEFIASGLSTIIVAHHLRDQLAALEQLRMQPTARLERAFADHVDCCSYRLDAWMLGLVNYQLSLMRNIGNRQDGAVRQGIYLGAYAWLEELRPENKILEPVTLQDPGLIEDFADAERPPLMRDSSNQGYIHAPSLNHAVAAAVLRNGFVSNATENNRQTMGVNLTSERVRVALALLEGIRAGQGLADLLGYQFERGLHDRHSLGEVDKFILDLRRAFPLRGDHLISTQPPEGESIEAIEARNVMDGLALVEHIKATGNGTYPFGKPNLEPVQTQQEADAIAAEVDRLLESHDAVADLALAEGVYQAVLGNYDRVASTYDAYARGNFPPEPDIVRTPFNGIGITHRVALHLQAGADPGTSPIAGLDMTPRAQAEPALNNWLAALLPALTDVSCVVSFRDAAGGGEVTPTVSLSDLELQPADLFVLIQDGSEQAMAELDDRILRHVVNNFDPRPDVPIAVRYLEKATPFSIFELIPLVRNVRRLTTQSRPLTATDLTLANEAISTQDSQPFVDVGRLTLVQAAMQELRDDFLTFQTRLAGPLSDLENRTAEILAEVDQYVDDLASLLARAATFAVAQAGWGFAYDFRRRVFAAMLKQAGELVLRWDGKLIEFNAAMDAELALPSSALPEERFELLLRAERAISSSVTSPLPADPAVFRDDLFNLKLPPFEAKRGEFVDLQATSLKKLADLLANVKTLLPFTDFDLFEFSTTAHEREMVLFTEDALSVAKVMIAELDRRLAASQDLFNQHATAPNATTAVRLLEDAAKVLLGSDFRIFPEFSLSTRQGDELANALDASRSDLFDHLKNPPDPNALAEDFPVDTWLYGVARVREKMYAWEQTVMFTGSLNRPEPELEAMQLPFVPGDRWLGLEFPPQLALDHDRLLYTAHFAEAFVKTARQCGMLLDEWSETIPTANVDTGIAFHHDRPNSEAPQTMLLVTPSEFRGAWQWQDLVDALNETLDLAKRRTIEPALIDQTPYATLLPATIMASQFSQLTIAANLALNNKVGLSLSNQ